MWLANSSMGGCFLELLTHPKCRLLFSILVEALNMSRLLSPIEENMATLHFCLGSGYPWGKKRTAFSTRGISRAISTCIICNAQLPFTTYYCSTTEAWQCQGLLWFGRCRAQKFVFVLKAPKSYLTTWVPGFHYWELRKEGGSLHFGLHWSLFLMYCVTGRYEFWTQSQNQLCCNLLLSNVIKCSQFNVKSKPIPGNRIPQTNFERNKKSKQMLKP